MTLLRTRHLELTIGDHTVCHGLDFVLEPGQCWALIGRNGAGKSTLLHTLAGLHPVQTGTIELLERPLAAWRRRELARICGLLLQDAEDPFPATVLETALMGRHPHLRAWQWEDAEDQVQAETVLAELDLVHARHRSVATLSGGERRRLALATLFVQDPSLLLLDEPTNHLDLHHQVKVLQQIQALTSAGRGALVVLHDVNLARRFCPYTLLLFGDGEALAGSTAEVLNRAQLERLYGHPIVSLASPWGEVYLPG